MSRVVIPPSIRHFVSPPRTTIIPRETTVIPIQETIVPVQPLSKYIIREAKSPEPKQKPQQVKTVYKEADHSFCEKRIKDLQDELELWRKRYLELQAQQDRHQSYEETITQLQERIDILIAENNKLNHSLKQRINELEESRIAIHELEVFVQANRAKADDTLRYQQLLNAQAAEAQEWKNRFLNMEKQYLALKHADITNMEQEGKLQQLTTELATWKERCFRAEREKKDLEAQLKKALQNQPEPQQPVAYQGVDQLQSQILRLKEQLNQALQDVDNWRNKALQFESQCKEEQQKNSELATEVDELRREINRLNAEILKLLKEIARLQDSVDKLNDKCSAMDQLNANLANLENQLQSRNKDLNDLQSAQSLLESKLHESQNQQGGQIQLNTTIMQLRNEIERLSQLLKKKELELDGWKSKYLASEKICGDLRQENAQIDPLQAELQSNEQELNSLKERLLLRDDKIKELEHVIEQLQEEVNQANSLKLDIHNLEQQVLFKTQELQKLKDSLTVVLKEVGQLRLLKQEVPQLQSDNAALRDELEDLKQHLREEQLQVDKLEFEVAAKAAELKQIPFLEEELAMYQGQLRNAIEECGQWKQKYGRLVQENLHLENNYRIIQGQEEEWRNENDKKQNQIECQNDMLQQLRVKCNKFEFDCDRLSKLNEDLENELKVNQEQLQKVREELEQLKTAYNKLQKQFYTQQLQMLSQQREFEQSKLKFEQQLDVLSLLAQQRAAEAKNWKEKYLKSEQTVTDLQFVGELLKQEQSHSRQLKIEIERLKNKQRIQVPGKVEHIIDLEQIQELRKSVSEFQQENRDLYNQLQKLKNQLVQREYQLQQSENSRNTLIQEVERLKSLIQSKIQDNEVIRAKNNEYTVVIMDLKAVEQRVPELESFSHLQEDHIKELNGNLSGKNGEFEKLFTKNNKDQIKLQGITLMDNQIQKLNELRKDGLQSTEEVKNELNLRNIELERALKEKEYYESKYHYLLLELQTLRSSKHSSSDQFNKMQQDLLNMSQQINEAKQLEQQFHQLQRDNQLLNDRVNKLQSENDRKDQLITDLQNQLRQLQLELERLRPFEAEVQHLRDLNADQLRQIQELNEESHHFENERETIINNYEHQIQDLNKQLQQLENQKNKAIQDLEAQLKRLGDENNKYRSQLEGLQNQISTLISENNRKDQLLKEMENLRNEYNKYKILYEKEVLVTSDLKQQLSELQQELNALIKEKDELLKRIIMLQGEIEAFGKQFQSKNEEIAALQKTITILENQLTLLKPMEAENTKLKQSYEVTSKELIEIKQQTADLKTQFEAEQKARNALQQLLNGLQGEFDQLKGKFAAKDNEINTLKSSLSKTELVVKSVKVIDNTNPNDLKTLTDQLAAKSKEAEEAKKKSNQYDNEIQKLKKENSEITKLNQTIQSKDKELDDLRRKIEKANQDLANIDKLKKELEQKLASTTSEWDRSKKSFENSQNELKKTEKTTLDLQNEIKRLTQSNKDLYDELQAWNTRYASILKETNRENTNTITIQPPTTSIREQTLRASQTSQNQYDSQRSSGYKANLFPQQAQTSNPVSAQKTVTQSSIYQSGSNTEQLPTSSSQIYQSRSYQRKY